MKKILIFENEYADHEPAFKAINLLSFDNQLQITQYNTSQELTNISNIDAYDAIIIDIDLSLKSHKDGFGIIQDIDTFNKDVLKKVMVLTGSSKVEEKLIEQGYDIRVAIKPIDIDQIADMLKDILK
ncbi:response regulator receiver protein [Sulfuricurvum kujiense DSM 16994]|uniref:Response regulator receiver protein n=1 Tax=Sulfuricurvum kujiense (strain ATCC BAA-921 / DSM 16994 / JCM 11577 / YK-1) TaxID=709032 RepID=E4TYU1_SULKY|nr:transcriptional regulator [Sulfuricurvum kujiense]ADR34082.1 response regulator receiver protein [Sulfuricurvum kujiense DSM 16994]